jgi:hypothetical protein
MANNSVVTFATTIRTLSAVGLIAFAGWVMPQGSQPTNTAERGVRCPQEFTPVWDATAKILKCRRDVVSWVVTACGDKEYSTYLVKTGPDVCGPTQIPGVGTAPGVTGTRAVSCAAPGYSLMTDRTGERDRCEKIERLFALPLPAR